MIDTSMELYTIEVSYFVFQESIWQASAAVRAKHALGSFADLRARHTSRQQGQCIVP